MKKLILPAILLSIGVGAAFATNANSNKAKASIAGYRIVDLGGGNTLCVDAQKTCSDIDGPVCTWTDGITALREFSSPTMCGNILHEPQP